MFEVDWSQAPRWANYWTAVKTGSIYFCRWWQKRPTFDYGVFWNDNNGAFEDAAPHFGYRGESKDSLTQRPNGFSSFLPRTSEQSFALDPSQEFPFTWMEIGTPDYGEFYRTAKEAEAAARSNYCDFNGELKDRTVYVVRVESVVNDGSS